MSRKPLSFFFSRFSVYIYTADIYREFHWIHCSVPVLGLLGTWRILFGQAPSERFSWECSFFPAITDELLVCFVVEHVRHYRLELRRRQCQIAPFVASCPSLHVGRSETALQSSSTQRNQIFLHSIIYTRVKIMNNHQVL